MVNPNTIANLFARAVDSKYKGQVSEPTNDDYDVCDYLLKVLDSVMRSSTFVFDEQSTLVFHDLNDEDEDIDVNYSEIENLC